MRINDVYLMALQKAEENATNGGIKLDRARFVQLFNAEQVRLVRSLLDLRDSNDIQYIQKLLVNAKKLDKVSDIAQDKSSVFALPEDFFFFSNISGVFKRGECEVTDFELEQVKNEDTHKLLADEFNKPDFDYRYTFYTVGNDGVRIFLADFSIGEFSRALILKAINTEDKEESEIIINEVSDPILKRMIKATRENKKQKEGDIIYDEY